MFLNRRSERPHAVLRLLTGCGRGLSGPGLGNESAGGRGQAVGGEIDAGRREMDRVLSPFAALAGEAATDPSG
jgi:hypothetical protein